MKRFFFFIILVVVVVSNDAIADETINNDASTTTTASDVTTQAASVDTKASNGTTGGVLNSFLSTAASVAGAQAGLQGRMLSNVFDAVDSSIISLKFCANIYLGTLIFDATPFPQRRFSLLTFSRCKGKFDISTLVKFPLTDLIPI